LNPGAPEELAVPVCCNTPVASVAVNSIKVTSSEGKENPTGARLPFLQTAASLQ